jgi:hypothetical protein
VYLDVPQEWVKLQNKWLYNFYCSPIIVRVIKFRRKARVGGITHDMRLEENLKFYVESLIGRDHI